MLSAFFEKEGICEFALLDFAVCRVKNRALYERMFPSAPPRAVAVFLIPYYVAGEGNISRYAWARDYHLYVKELACRAEGLPHFLSAAADHSPIDERALALAAGLGVRGDNGLVISPRYGSYCFIGTLFFAAPPAPLSAPVPVRECLHCGACQRACPMRREGVECLSHLSQKKTLTETQAAALARHGVIWGCDLCQEVCPYNRDAEQTPIAFFREALCPQMSEAELARQLEEGQWAQRAYAWRPPDVLRRNLALAKGAKKDEN